MNNGDFMERLYRRTRSYYVYVLLGVGALNTLLGAVWVVGLMCLYFGGSMADFLSTLAVAEAGVGTTFMVCGVAIYRHLAPVRAVLAGTGSSDDLVATWKIGISEMPWIVAGVVVTLLVFTAPAFVYGGHRLDLSPISAVVEAVTAVVLVVGFSLLAYLFVEQAIRPLARELAPDLPEDFQPPATMSLSAKLLGILMTITLFTAVLVSGLTETSLSREAQLGAAILVSLTAPLGLALLLRRALIDRFRELIDALGRVREGDLGVRLHNIAGDEFDEVGASFNAMVAELRESRARIVTASDEARRRVERDLHDGAQQRLVLVKLRLEATKRLLEKDPDAATASFGELDAELAGALAELRDLARGIYPPLLEHEGLPAALGEAVNHAAIPASLDCDGTGRFPAEVEAAVYFCCLEALQNAAKHAGEGASVNVKLGQQDGILRFEVADDGAGFDPETATASSGVQNLRDRIGALGGRVEIQSSPGHGTTVSGAVPLAGHTSLQDVGPKGS